MIQDIQHRRCVTHDDSIRSSREKNIGASQSDRSMDSMSISLVIKLEVDVLRRNLVQIAFD